jgi:hypothetical protein
MNALHSPRRRRLIQLAALGAGGLALGGAHASAAPEVLATNLVVARNVRWSGKDCLAVELTDAEQARIVAGGGANGPTYAIVSPRFEDGVIEIDVAAELTERGQKDSRGFVGVAFHIDGDAKTYEAVYLRMANGGLNSPPPPPPLIDRAVQYVAHPDFHFRVSREKFPGRYERPAKVAIARWHRLRFEIAGSVARVLVDGEQVLRVDDLHYARRAGPVGLFIDDGTRGYFADLRIVAA